MSNKNNLERDLMFVARFDAKVPDVVASNNSAFTSNLRKTTFISAVLLGIGKLLEALLGVKLYVKVFGDEFDFIGIRLKKLAHRLLREDIISSFRLRPYPENWPIAFNAGITLKSILLPSGKRWTLSGTHGSGCAMDYNTAARKALAETLERYSLCVYSGNSFITASFSELKKQNAIDPQKFSCFSKTQLADSSFNDRHAFNDSTEFRWTEARSILDRRHYLVPAQLACLMYEPIKGEPIIRQTTTNGAAAGSNWEMAAYNAICESVERDALMIFWLNRLTPSQIDLSDEKYSSLVNILEQCRHRGVNISILDITTDLGIPTVMAVWTDSRSGRPAVYVSPRTDLDIDKAIANAVIECLKAELWEDVSEDTKRRISQMFPSPQTIEQRRIFWVDAKKIKDVEFLLQGSKKPAPENKFSGADICKKLEEIKTILRTKNIETYMVDVTSKVARESGLTVLMSLMPGLYPLYLDEHYKYLGVPRLYSAPVRLGYLSKSITEEKMNPVPHPML